MIATTTLLGRALAPVEQVLGSWRVLAEGRAALGRLQVLLAADDAQPERMALPAPSGELVAHNLVFRAPQGERLILAGISLALNPGESLAVIGPSAAGKSTLIRLLTGVWAPSAGTVRLDAADLSKWPRDQIGPHMSYVRRTSSCSLARWRKTSLAWARWIRRPSPPRVNGRSGYRP